ncbi:hypothetical protein OG788_41620 [Streptomyces sp. NBC_00647]|uniref:hypothetical protein n=1 Tax=Streptomyces sp. NBC_00647 TaxID=2975796 RepID=UPI00324A3357
MNSDPGNRSGASTTSGPAAPAAPAAPEEAPTRPVRITPLPPERWTPELRGLLAGSAKDGPGRVNLFGTLAHHPELAARLALARPGPHP